MSKYPFDFGIGEDLREVCRSEGLARNAKPRRKSLVEIYIETLGLILRQLRMKYCLRRLAQVPHFLTNVSQGSICVFSHMWFYASCAVMTLICIPSGTMVNVSVVATMDG